MYLFMLSKQRCSSQMDSHTISHDGGGGGISKGTSRNDHASTCVRVVYVCIRNINTVTRTISAAWANIFVSREGDRGDGKIFHFSSCRLYMIPVFLFQNCVHYYLVRTRRFWAASLKGAVIKLKFGSPRMDSAYICARPV